MMPQTCTVRPSSRVTFITWLKRVHGWIGLWGALLGLLFGISGLLLNHRAELKIPAIEYAGETLRLPVPEAARASLEAMTAWLSAALKLPSAKPRSQREPARPVPWAGGAVMQPERWSIGLNTPRERVQASYWLGDGVVEVKREAANFYATLTRLHMGAGLGSGWILFADTLAGGLMALVITGVLLWTQLHRRRLFAFVLVGGSTATLAVLVLPKL